jgi:type IV pilus assembly protein PilW
MLCDGILPMKMKKHMMPMPAIRQHGFNMIEMIVSIGIGLVIILFVSSLYIGSRSIYQVNDDSSRMQQDGRIVMALIGRNLTQAGYGQPASIQNGRLLTNFTPTGQAFNACDFGFFAPSTLGDKTCAGGAGDTAGFEVSYLAERVFNVNIGAGVDCNGQQVPVDANGDRIVTNRFYLFTKAGETQSLYCVGSGNATGQPLLGNVDAMKLTYGVDVNGDNAPDGFHTTTAAALAAQLTAVPTVIKPFDAVVSVGVCLQVSSPNNVLKQSQKFRNCNGELITATDRKLHTTLTNVFTIRNNSGTTLLSY